MKKKEGDQYEIVGSVKEEVEKKKKKKEKGRRERKDEEGAGVASW